MDPEQPKDATTVTNRLSGTVVVDHLTSGFMPAQAKNFVSATIMIGLAEAITNSSSNDFPFPIIVNRYLPGTAF